MKCPNCVAQGLRSSVKVGHRSQILKNPTVSYDEAGNYHHGRQPPVVTHYSCSNGHRFTSADIRSSLDTQVRQP